MTPLSDLSHVPGLAPSSVYSPLPGRSSPVIRPALPLAPGVPRRSLDPTFSTYAASPRTQETVLTWDGLVKEVNLKPGELKANFAFAFTNSSSAEVVVNAVRTSCGCTTAKLPALPWKLPAGTNASFEVVMDVRGKSGIVTKTVTIETSAGYRYLTTRASVPASGAGGMATADRARNLQVALADRQAALKGDCAVCHVTPGVGKHGEELYVAVCGVCHEAEHRASMVPNLQALNKPFKPEDWQRIIHSGKKDSLMPAFAASEGGPLTEDQVQSLVTYLTGPFKTAPATVSKRTPVTTLPAGFPQE